MSLPYPDFPLTSIPDFEIRLPMTLYLGSFINGLTHSLEKLRQTSQASLFFMCKTFILALHQGKSVQNRGQSVILSGENHRLPYTIIGGVATLFRAQHHRNAAYVAE